MLDKLVKTFRISHQFIYKAYKINFCMPSFIVPVIASQKKPDPTQVGKLVDELMLLLNRNSTAFAAKQEQIKSHSQKYNTNTMNSQQKAFRAYCK